ncbi:integrase catalytic domain-containing protein [Trichonephila clavata]|uniref:Integrase catalytic domain-containing protein n=1 Tax=Trichonephila clavata TaxID=2740835 RepID=A0A8X6J7G3_TRICU|nr:integrase catalytic domain-containing protein [Trichonephila clavata]
MQEKKHHVSICKTPTNEQSAITSTNKIDTSTYNYVHLQTARVFITGSNGITKLTRCLLDGSQSSFISSDLVHTLNLPVISTGSLDLQAFESPTSFSYKRREVQFQLSSIWDKSKVNVIAFESSNRYASNPSSPTDVSRFAKSKRMKLADPDDSLSSLPIEILNGADFYWNVMHSDAPVKLSDFLALVPSSFGWILSGSRSHATVSFNPTVHSINVDTLTHDLDNMVRNFWNLESIGIQPTQEKLRLSTHNDELMTNFHQSFKIIDDRRVVHLPWKQEVRFTLSNYDTAIHRFNSWTRRIHANTELKQKYAKQMQDYIDKKQVEAVLKDTQNEVRLFYLLHHAVKNITNEEIKWRIVFDASSHSPGHPSLNDALEAGPNLLPDILAMLLRFRLSKIAITSDGSQVFLQLILADEDRDATRFLWYKTGYTSDGNHTKLLRVTAWILRFVHNCKSHLRIIHELNCNELEKAKDYWIQIVQRQCFSAEINALKEGRPLQKKSKISCFNPFLKDDYLRLGGRLQFSDIPFDTQHPLILDGNHPFVHLLIQHTHIRLHHLGVRIALSELRSTFWILRGRQAIKKALHKCLPCKLFKAKCGMQIEAPLPSERVVPSVPFTITEIDFTGPVNIRCLKPRDTAYIALFTCATTRALHIEHSCIVKQCLRKVLGRALLDEESLSTVLIGIEAALKSRPLVYEEESDDNSAALTPAHFLTGRKLTAIPSRIENTRLNKIYKQQQDLLNCFWKKWSKEYLLQLRSFHQVRNKDSTINIRVGDIVLLQDVRPRHMWKKARVMNLHQGRDGKIRSCELRVNGRNVTRPVQLVIPLEIDQGGEDVGNEIKFKV